MERRATVDLQRDRIPVNCYLDRISRKGRSPCPYNWIRDGRILRRREPDIDLSGNLTQIMWNSEIVVCFVVRRHPSTIILMIFFPKHEKGPAHPRGYDKNQKAHETVITCCPQRTHA